MIEDINNVIKLIYAIFLFIFNKWEFLVSDEDLSDSKSTTSSVVVFDMSDENQLILQEFLRVKKPFVNILMI